MFLRTFCVFLILSLFAQADAQDEKSIIEKLDHEKVCFPTVDDFPSNDPAKANHPAVPHATLITEAVDGNDLNISFADLKSVPYETAVLAALVPCLGASRKVKTSDASGATQTKSVTGYTLTTLSARMNHCWQAE